MSNYNYYNELLERGEVLNRTDSGLCNILEVADNQTDSKAGLFHIVGLHGFSQYADYINTAGAIMGFHHFNTRNATVVAELGNLTNTCPVRMTFELHDTGRNERIAVKELSNVLTRDSRLPCGITGATKSSVSIPIATLSHFYDLPQINWSSGTDDLSNRELYPYFVRTIPASGAKAIAAVKYLSSIGVKHCVALHKNDAYGNAYLRAFQQAAQVAGILVRTVVYSPKTPDEAINAVKDTKFRYTYCCVVSRDYETIMTEVYNQNLYGPDHVWFIGNKFPADKTFPRGSPLDVVSESVAFIRMTTIHPNNEKFNAAWDSLSMEEIDQIDSMMPHHPDGTFLNHYGHSDNGLWNEKQAYDAVVSLGLALCSLYSKNGGYDFTAEALYDEIINRVFIGASGLVKIDAETGTRSPTSVSPRVYYFNRIEQNSTHSTFDAVLSVELEANSDGTNWDMVDVSKFVYFGNSLIVPDDLPPLNGGKGIDMQYIGGLRFLAYILFALIMVLAATCMGWTYRYKSERVVMASQPLFLRLIIVGVVIMASSMVTLSVDDEHFSQLGCDIACMMSPWFFFMGFVVCFSALFSKTWRTNRLILNPAGFQKVKVEVKDVIAPLVLFLVVNLVILICWTALSPMKFVREYDIDATDAFNRVIESSGSCLSVGSQPYIISLSVINLSIVIFANFQSYKARHISMDYSESSYISIVMGSLLQIGIVGIPVLLIAKENPRAFFTISCLAVFVLSAVILVCIFLPKMRNQHIKKLEKKKKQEERDKRRRIAEESGAFQSCVGFSATETSNFNSSVSLVESVGGADGLGFVVMTKGRKTANGVIVGSTSHSHESEEH